MSRLSTCLDLTLAFKTVKPENVASQIISDPNASGHSHWLMFGLAVPPPTITWKGHHKDVAWVVLDIEFGDLDDDNIVLPNCGWWGCLNKNHLIICDKKEAAKVRRALIDGLPYVRKQIKE